MGYVQHTCSLSRERVYHTNQCGEHVVKGESKDVSCDSSKRRYLRGLKLFATCKIDVIQLTGLMMSLGQQKAFNKRSAINNEGGRQQE